MKGLQTLKEKRACNTNSILYTQQNSKVEVKHLVTTHIYNVTIFSTDLNFARYKVTCPLLLWRYIQFSIYLLLVTLHVLLLLLKWTSEKNPVISIGALPAHWVFSLVNSNFECLRELPVHLLDTKKEWQCIGDLQVTVIGKQPVQSLLLDLNITAIPSV